MPRFLLWAALGGLAAAAWGADVALEAAAPEGGVSLWPPRDKELELKWDSGTRMWWLAWITGADLWMGNDFDVSTIARYRGLEAIRVMTNLEWPNAKWDGFRVGVYAFDRVPGSLMWPTSGGGYFFKPTGETGWKDVPVNWTLPKGVTAFLAAMEQYYPRWGDGGLGMYDFDPYAIDNNPVFRGHTWLYRNGPPWELFYLTHIVPYRNLMLRVVVADDLAVNPSSIGRVKALYY